MNKKTVDILYYIVIYGDDEFPSKNKKTIKK